MGIHQTDPSHPKITAQPLIYIIGQTAIGKTAIAAKLAHHLNLPIISADSRQVYKHLNIGTGKDLHLFAQYTPAISYHMIDIIHPRNQFSVFDYQNMVYQLLNKFAKKNHGAIIVGGSGLYINSILFDYRFNRARHRSDNLDTPQDNCFSADYRPPKVFILKMAKWYGNQRIEERLTERLAQGMIKEVENLITLHSLSHERLEKFGLEYRYCSRYLQGRLDFQGLHEKLYTEIKRFAKRQRLWFRKAYKIFPSSQLIDCNNTNSVYDTIQNHLNHNG